MNKRLFIVIFLGLILITFITIVSITSANMGNKVQNTTDTTNQITSSIIQEETSLEDSKVIEIKDKELEKIIRTEVSKYTGDILVSDMKKIEFLSINYMINPVYELDGLEYATNLTSFSYKYGKLKSLDPIANIEKMDYIGLNYSTLEIMPTKFNLPNLRASGFTETNVSDYAFISDCSKIEDLIIVRSGLSNLSFLSKMTNINSLDLSDNCISDISVLKNLTKIVKLYVHQNKVSDISVLLNCSLLESVNISYNNVSNITSLYNLSGLKEVTAYESLDKLIIPRDQFKYLSDKGVTCRYN